MTGSVAAAAGLNWAPCTAGSSEVRCRSAFVDRRGRIAMASFCVLGTFTEKGVHNAKDSPKRADGFRDMAKKCKVTVKELYWAQGQYDIVAILEAEDDLAVTSLALSVAALGNVRTQTLRLFTAADMKKVIDKIV